ncbi:MAG: phosphoribosylglycinamide synthetase C domain-containing protein, partial [Bacteroidota bacterium]
KGKVMTGFEQLAGVIPFHAGTKREGEQVLTNGGRVLALSAFGKDIEAARQVALAAANTMQFEGKTFRGDIGLDLQ